MQRIRPGYHTEYVNMLEIRKLHSLSLEEKRSLVYRDSLELEGVISETVKPIAHDIESFGLSSLKKFCEKYDSFFPENMILEPDDLEKQFNEVLMKQPDIIEAFSKARDNLESFHRLQIPEDFEAEIAQNRLGFKYIPFESVALYVPGGKALYPSTVLMGVIPARLAGVKEINIITPPDKSLGQVNPVVLAMAHLAGATRVIQAGGAHAIIAAATGISEWNLKPVDFIYGPGNIYVSAAKSYVASKGYCGIDSFAGPSEVVIIADKSANPYWLAHDLLAQAEHDENATSILLTDDEEIASKTAGHIERAIESRDSDRKNITRESIKRNGKILVCESLNEAVAFSNEFAPEHLEIQTSNDDEILSSIKAAGSIFLGRYAPVAMGDYYSGTNHILPTNRAARFSSGVSVQSFYRRVTYQKISYAGLEASRGPITVMSKAEGLFDEHGYSILARFEENET